jgi:hypothetical protein
MTINSGSHFGSLFAMRRESRVDVLKEKILPTQAVLFGYLNQANGSDDNAISKIFLNLSFHYQNGPQIWFEIETKNLGIFRASKLFRVVSWI